MNKTVSINIGSLFFHIDDNAYAKLNYYLEAIKSSLSADSREEVMNDIEARIGEILSSRIQPDKQVINTLDIDYIISVMGQPEDYIIEYEEPRVNSKSKYNSYENSYSKRLFRDEDEGKIGGVCAGLGHYIGIDTLWIRIFLILTIVLGYGIGIIIYLGLWIMVPKATTTSDKLQMRGEPINISNIEKKVKEGYDKVTNSISDFSQSDLKKNITNTSSNAVNNIEKIAIKLLNIVGKIIGVILFLISLISIGSLIIFCGILMFSSNFFIEHNLNMDVPFQGISLFTFGLLILITSVVPLLFLFFLSLKILNPTFKFLGKYSILGLISIWVLAIFGWIFFGINESLSESQTGKFTQKTTFNIAANDTLKINMNNNSFYSVDIDPDFRDKIVKDETGKKVLYSNKVEIIFKESESNEGYFIVEKTSKSSSIDKAISFSKNIKYNIDLKNNELNLDNYFLDLTAQKNKQKVNIYVFVPKNTVIKLNKIAKNYAEGAYDSYNTINPIYKLNEYEEMTCLNCNSEVSNKTINTDLNNINEILKLETELDSVFNAVN